MVAAGWVGTALVLLGAIAVGRYLERPFSDFSRDPLAILGGPVYIGFVSQLGIAVWAVGCGACLVGALTLRGDLRRALVHGGVLTAVLMVDDMVQVHESYRDVGAIPLAQIGYAALAVLFLCTSARAFHRRLLWLYLAAAFFGVSAALDVALDADSPLFVEDGSKLFGVVTWSCFFVGVTVDALRAPSTVPALA